MILDVFEKNNRTRVDMIRTYNYVYYEDEDNGIGKFEITIPTNETSLIWLTVGNFILFDEGVVGIIKGVKEVETSDNEINIYGYLSNHILEFRSFLLTSNYYDTVPEILLSMFDELFVNPTDVRRRIGFLTVSEDIPTIPGKVRYQSTGKTFLETGRNLFETNGLSFGLYPHIENYNEQIEQYANLSDFEFYIKKPADRTIGNTEGNIPIVFSFDLNNLSQLTYEEDAQTFASVAIVASEGVGEERKTVEVHNTEEEYTGYERIELYVDARDLQTTDEQGQQELTDEELEEVMIERGKEKLKEHERFITFDASILQGKYKYGVDYFKGDYVSVVSKIKNKIFDAPITSVRKTYSNGVEHFDVTLGVDRMKIRQLKEREIFRYG
ncbi:MAG: siphovirus ReqiPepy6 Gp37-like family protein [Methanobrevibacter sp.]|nr:siphovirus ReqiPepy6 Gp37-like family protein [Methanobrevibacter sp.]